MYSQEGPALILTWIKSNYTSSIIVLNRQRQNFNEEVEEIIGLSPESPVCTSMIGSSVLRSRCPIRARAITAYIQSSPAEKVDNFCWDSLAN